MREKPAIAEDQLYACLMEHYGLAVVALEFLPLGLDTRSAVYRVVSGEGETYLLKARAGAFYEPSCYVPRFLHDQGITAVVAPLRAKSQTLWTPMADWVVTVYPFIAGESNFTHELTAAQWRSLGKTLRQIQQTPLPPGGIAGLRQETFDVTEYRHGIQLFDARFAALRGESQIAQALRACWLEHQGTIHEAMTSLMTLADVLQQRSDPLVICHADLHTGNMICGEADNVFVIDWEDVKLALKERDFLFIESAPVNAAARQDLSPFFHGYGQTTIDWAALTYYLWERIVQDVIVSAQIIMERDDLGEASKTEEFHIFRSTLAEDGSVAIARAAAAHLPA